MVMRAVVIAALLLVLISPSSVRTENANQTAVLDSQVQWRLLKPEQISWRDGPPSLLPGARMAILEGDPTKEGFFTMRLELPDGYRVFPHWHPKTERLTIISGILNLGTGDRFDPQATQALPAGTYSSMPPKMAHFAWMRGETILQLSSIGPWEVVYVNPADDPRISAK
jgi:hypothetical protein